MKHCLKELALAVIFLLTGGPSLGSEAVRHFSYDCDINIVTSGNDLETFRSRARGVRLTDQRPGILPSIHRWEHAQSPRGQAGNPMFHTRAPNNLPHSFEVLITIDRGARPGDLRLYTLWGLPRPGTTLPYGSYDPVDFAQHSSSEYQAGKAQVMSTEMGITRGGRSYVVKTECRDTNGSGL